MMRGCYKNEVQTKIVKQTFSTLSQNSKSHYYSTDTMQIYDSEKNPHLNSSFAMFL